MSFTPGTEHLLQVFIILCGVLFIPVAIGLLVVLFKLAFLLHSASELLTFVSCELTPLVKELRSTVDHIENIGQKASSGVRDIENGIESVKPVVQSGFHNLKVVTSALVSGISRSFERSR